MKKRKMRRPGPNAEGILPFIIDPEPYHGLTSFGGLPLVAEAFRSLGLFKAAERELGIKKSPKGLSDGQLTEAFLLLFAGGGERVDDFTRMREEGTLGDLLGYEPPTYASALRFLYAFHDDALLAKRPPLSGTAWVPEESERLAALHRLNQRAVAAIASVLPPARTRTATLDHDATVIESHKREALAHYKGGRGYQPVFVLWSELDLAVADEFRDGNVPAGAFNLALIKRAFDGLPPTVEKRYFRADSACYDQTVLSYLRHENIGFAVSADMSTSLRAHITALPPKAWKPLDAGREWAEVVFVPYTALFEPDDVTPDRYIAIRKQPRQLTLWEQDGYSYWAVATNMPGKGDDILAWHRQKAGTIEHFHAVLKNELALGVMPCGRFGADAAWSRLNVLTYNVLSYLKQTVLPPALGKARPKRLRYEIFRLAGVVIRHARCVVVRLGASAARIGALREARYQLAGLWLAAPG
jgi:hypothetical protein